MTVEEWLGTDNQLSVDIWHKKYQHNNETFDEWLDRVSNHHESVKNLIKEKKFIFGGRILSNRGIQDSKVTLSNCYVIASPEDNLESIYDCRKELARTYSYGGGCGIDISKLSPAGAKVNNQAKYTSGAVSFMEGFSQTTAEIGQNGRRGALMISLDCHHPDLPEFIDIKTKDGAVTKANISVKVTDDFMNAVINDETWLMSFTRPETGEVIERKVLARELFHKLCENNWNWAEPGILFWDRIQNYNLLSNDPEFKYDGVNPCAEEPLPAGGSCLLGSINLAEFVIDNKYFDYTALENAVNTAVFALNEVLMEGLPLHPLKQQQETVNDWRQIGLGVMGIADMLIKLGIKYDSSEAIKFCDNVASIISYSAILASSQIAKSTEVYPKYSELVADTEFFDINAYSLRDMIYNNGLANSQLLTIAPTGTISTMLGVSGGIEPIFANYYTRKTESLNGEDTYYKVYTPIVKKYMEEYNLTDESDLPDYFVTSATIDPKKRVEMQATWQKHIDASISSTINLPESATVEDIEDLYIYAWEKGCKGLTIYRSGCKRDGILTTSDKKTSTEVEKANSENSSIIYTDKNLPRGTIIECSDDLIGKKRKLTTGCGSLHVLAYFDPNDGSLLEVYLSKGSTGGCQNYMIALSRIISLACRAGVDVSEIKDQLDSTGACPSYATRSATKHDTSKGSCCAMAIGNALLDMYKEMQSEIDYEDEEELFIKPQQYIKHEHPITGEKCPECGAPLYYEGGCVQCHSCGWSKCG